MFSLATFNKDGSTNMNILTYAVPVRSGRQDHRAALTCNPHEAVHYTFVSILSNLPLTLFVVAYDHRSAFVRRASGSSASGKV